MSQDVERVRERMENIRTVKPILGAMRTISLGSWQMALNRGKEVQRYSAALLEILPVLLPHLTSRYPGAGLVEDVERYGARLLSRIPGLSALVNREPGGRPRQEGPRRIRVVVLGSERGLVGNFNERAAARLDAYVRDLPAEGVELQVVALGSRLIRLLKRRGYTLFRTREMPVTSLPPFELAFEFTKRWLDRYEGHELDAVDVIYNAYGNAGQYAPDLTRLVPPELPQSETPFAFDPEDAPILETDPLSLYTRVVQQWAAIGFYRLLLESLASEHSTRFRLMESATQNADDLVDQLTQELQSARRQAITREMQELAAGAGLIR